MKLALGIFLAVFSLSSATLPNLIDLANNNNATTLTQFVDAAGLTDVLKEQGPFTCIIPTNEAFAKLPANVVSNLKQDTSALANVLQYHCVKGMIFSWDLVSGEILTSLNGHQIRIYSRGSTLFFNQAKALKVDIQGKNGVIYLVDEVLNVPEGTVVDILQNPDYNISMFLEFVQKANLVNTFNRTTSSRYTVFAPTNAAFMSLEPAYLQKLKTSYTYARHIVDYHVHPGTLHFKSLDHTGKISTMYRGHSISVNVDTNSVATLNHAAKLLQTDIEAENGVVHVLSHVLIPSTLNPGIVG